MESPPETAAESTLAPAQREQPPEEGGRKKRKRGNREGIELGLPSEDEMMGGRRMRRVASGLLDTDAVHRRSIEALAKLVVAGRRTIVITGAGLSCASGIPPFRSKSGDKDAVWARHMEQIGTRAGFLADPCGWYNDFWLPNFSPSQLHAKSPNSGHEAIASLALCAPHLRVVTQNIDALHQSTTIAWPAQERLIEAHGRVGLYKCASDPDEGCPYSEQKSLKPEQFSTSTQIQLGHGSPEAKSILQDIPVCPHCNQPCMPQALLFDEDYSDHDFYQFERLQQWLEEAEVLVFVGTSFAVTLTSMAMDKARERKVPVYNFNTDVEDKVATPTLNWHNVEGRAEERLPELLAAIKEYSEK